MSFEHGTLPLAASARLVLAALACAALAAGCERQGKSAEPSGGEEREEHADHEEHGEHAEHEEHGEHEREPELGDAHHLAEGRPHCEEDVALSPDALARYGIEVAPVRAMALAARISAPGHLAIPEGALARVGAPAAGRVAELRVRSGDRVAAGDTLLVVSSPALAEAQSDYLRKRALAAGAEPALELAEQALARAEELRERAQGIALAEVQKRALERGAAERELAMARALERAGRQRLELFGMRAEAIAALEEGGALEPRIAVEAPIAGRVIELGAALGDWIEPADDRAVVVADLSTLWAIAEVSESRQAEVQLGAAAEIEIPALQEPRRAGRVAALAPVLEAATRTVEVRIELENADGRLLPGMFLQVEIESSQSAGAARLAVPDGAVLSVAGKPSVFVPIAPGASTFCRHEIEVGAPIGEHVPVLSGLAEGELVVVAGAFRLKAEHGKAAAQHEH